MTDDDVAGLRAFLADGDEVTSPLFIPETGSTTPTGSVLFTAAFSVAVLQKFSPAYTVPDIIRYVTDLRTRLGERVPRVNPRVTEGLIRGVLGDKDLKDREPYGADEEAISIAVLAVLLDLFHAANLDGPELDRFLRDVGDYARRWLSEHKATAAK
ncbi:hypothetical protein [Spirillospora sp. NPDC048823]|uniref:hypothetical protein n=1 Tax=unclassified Spirillospora TaxID=2642701 RepID=UPI00371ABB1A